MKKSFTTFVIVILMIMSDSAFSQNVVVIVGLSSTSYPTLQSAFAAINSGIHGNTAIIVQIVGNTVETGTATLNWVASTISIFPAGPRTITANLNTAVIILNGANNVNITGINSGGNSLTITNLSAGTNANGIECINGASNNIISYLEAVGSGAGGATAGGRGIYIGASAGGTAGNNNNLIEGCLTNGFRRGIQTFGTAGSFINSGTTIRGCKVKNFTSIGIFVGSETQNNLIENNEVFYDAVVINDETFSGSRCINIQGCGSQIVRNNKVYNISGSVASGYYGIISIPTSFTAPIVTPPTKVEFYNNMIALDNVISTAPFIRGIYVVSNTKNYTSHTYFNSIRIGGSSSGATLVFTDGLTVVQNGLQGPDTSRVYNNVTLNARTGGVPSSQHRGQNLNPEPNVSLEADYNVAHSDDPLGGWDYWYEDYLYNGELGMHILHDTTCERDIEQNTVFIRPEFVSSADLHLSGSLIGANMDGILDGSAGYPRTIPGLPTTDIDGDSRAITGTNLFTYRGCDEINTAGKRSWTINFKLQETVCYPYIVSIGLRYFFPPYEIWDRAWYRVRNCISSNVADVRLNLGPAIATIGTSRYLEISTKHSIRTQSSSSVNFTNPTGTYNFTLGTSTAYGGNMTGPPPFRFYNGDVNQDDVIDGTDGAAVDNDAFNFVNGCSIANDVNDDGTVDGSDGAIVDNNAYNFVTAVLLPGTGQGESSHSGNDKQPLRSNIIQNLAKVIRNF